MRTVELVRGIHSSALGFGCAPILGSVDAKSARHALDCALDCGITHFDLARSYGYGEAESFVGKVLKGQRDNVVLASKFGIRANWKAQLLRPVKPLVRWIRSEKKNSSSNTASNEKRIYPVSDRFHDRLPLRGTEMRKSLEQSLRALQTDYLDYFFIHEPQIELFHIDELTATAEKLKSEGKIRAWGLAYMRTQAHLHHSYLDRFDVLQFDNSPGAAGYEEAVRSRGLKPNVLFSPLRGGTIKMSPTEKLSKLFDDFPDSVVLCSMYNTQHLKQNIALLL